MDVFGQLAGGLTARCGPFPPYLKTNEAGQGSDDDWKRLTVGRRLTGAINIKSKEISAQVKEAVIRPGKKQKNTQINLAER